MGPKVFFTGPKIPGGPPRVYSALLLASSGNAAFTSKLILTFSLFHFPCFLQASCTWPASYRTAPTKWSLHSFLGKIDQNSLSVQDDYIFVKVNELGEEVVCWHSFSQSVVLNVFFCIFVRIYNTKEKEGCWHSSELKIQNPLLTREDFTEFQKVLLKPSTFVLYQRLTVSNIIAVSSQGVEVLAESPRFHEQIIACCANTPNPHISSSYDLQYSAFGKYSDPFSFFTFCNVAALC